MLLPTAAWRVLSLCAVWRCLLATGEPCSVVPDYHRRDEYPGSAQLWERMSEILLHYKSQRGICNEVANTSLPSITAHHLRMPDGVHLWTIVINPSPLERKKGAVLCRSPYGPTSQHLSDIFVVSNGYAAVLQDDRGTWRSSGEFNMWQTSGEDALETMSWITRQDWSNGQVYTVGASADGISSATVIMLDPPMLRSQWFIWMTTQGHHFVYPGGAYRVDMIENYMRMLDITTGGASSRVISEVRHHEPWSPWWYNLTGCRNLSQPQLPQCHFQQVRWPIIMNVGWWDLFQVSALETWDGVRWDSDISVRDSHVLFVGPLGHCILGSPLHPEFFAGETAGLVAAAELATEFFSGNVSGHARSKLARINLYVMGTAAGARAGNYWTSLDEFPTSSGTTWYLAAKRRLVQSPEAVPSSASFVYDPKDPAPMLGGNNLPGIGSISTCGTADMAARNRRSDVLVFTSDKLSEDVAIVGGISVRLFVESSAVDTDFFVTIEDVRPRWLLRPEQSWLVRYGVLRMRWRELDTREAAPLDPGRVYEVVVRCGNSAYVLQRGHKLRVTVSSAAAPYVNPTSNTGKFELIEPVDPVKAVNTVHMGSSRLSAVTLPVVDLASIPRNRHFDSPSMATKMATWGRPQPDVSDVVV